MSVVPASHRSGEDEQNPCGHLRTSQMDAFVKICMEVTDLRCDRGLNLVAGFNARLECTTFLHRDERTWRSSSFFNNALKMD